MKRLTVIGFIFLLVVDPVYALQENADIRKVGLEEFIRIASQSDTRFEEILTDRLYLNYKNALELPTGDFVLSLKSKHNFLFDPKDDDTENTVSLDKLFPGSGTEVSLAYTSSLNKSTRDMSSEFVAEVSQPIAENAFGRNTRLLRKIVGMEIEVAEFQIIEAYEDYLASLIQLYYNWYSAYENVRTAKNSYEENLKLLENIKEREKYKIALPVDVNKVRLQVASKKETLLTEQNKYNEYLTLIRESIRYSDKDELQPAPPKVYQGVSIDFEPDYLNFATESRTADILKMLEEKSALEVDKYADELLPSIDLIVGYELEGRGHNLKDDEGTFYAGLSLDWPLPRTVEKARLNTAKIDLKKVKLSSENIHLRLRTNLQNLYDQIVKEKELITIAQDKIKLAEAIVEEEKKNYSLGIVTLNDLIDEVNKLEDNKFNKIFHEVEMDRLVVEWLRLTDNLIQRNEVIKD
jgi:outer membrane protein TolC